MTDIVNLKRKDLLSLPNKEYTEIKRYESIILVPTTHKHDSGWRLIAIVGCGYVDGMHNIPIEIAGYCDDVQIIPPDNSGGFNKFPINISNLFQCDMLLSNCVRFHSNTCYFEIGCFCSSTDVKLIFDKNKWKNRYEQII